MVQQNEEEQTNDDSINVTFSHAGPCGTWNSGVMYQC